VAGNDGGFGGCTADARNDDAARCRSDKVQHNLLDRERDNFICHNMNRNTMQHN